MKGGREAGEADRGFGGRRFLREGEGRADAFFLLPVSPGIAMSLGRKIMSGVPSIILSLISMD